MLADLERATFSNIEHQGIEFVTHTLQRWLERWKQEGNYKLFTNISKVARQFHTLKGAYIFYYALNHFPYKLYTSHCILSIAQNI